MSSSEQLSEAKPENESRRDFLKFNWSDKPTTTQGGKDGEGYEGKKTGESYRKNDIEKPNVGEAKVFEQKATSGEILSVEEEVFVIPGTRSEIDFIGVTHMLGEFYYWRDLIEDRVKNSDYVVCEYAPFEETWDMSDPTKKELVSGEGSNFKTTSAYFEQIVELAKEYNKPVACVDPHNFYFSMYLSLPTTMQAVLPGVLAVEAGTRLINKNLKKPISRREFLAWATISGLGFYLDYTASMPTSVLRSMVQSEDQMHEQLVTYGFDDQFIFDSTNYRNLTISENMQELGQEFDGKKFSLFYGRAHRGAVKEYVTVDHAIEKGMKALPRKVLDLIGDNTPRIYDWDKAQNKWVKRNDTGE